MTLQKRDMQLFKKRLRKYISKHNEGINEWVNQKNEKIEKCKVVKNQFFQQNP